MNTMLVWLLFLPSAQGYMMQAEAKYANQEECRRIAALAIISNRTLCVQATIIKESK